jgi:hypothetical protein
MLPSQRHRREQRHAAGSAAPSRATPRYDTPVADGRNVLLAPPHFAAPLLPWRSGAVWRVVAVAASPVAKAEDECRWCFSPADAALEGELIEPCFCSGSQVASLRVPVCAAVFSSSADSPTVRSGSYTRAAFAPGNCSA